MKKIVVAGSGGCAKEVAYLIDDINRVSKEWDMLGYIDNNTGARIGKYNVIGDDSWLGQSEEELYVVIGIGDTAIIRKLKEKYERNSKLKFPTLIHPTVSVDIEGIEMGRGNIIFAGTLLTTNIKIGSFNLINLACTISHDSVLGDCNVISPSVNILGGVHIADEVFIGAGTQLLQTISITGKTTIGAGAVVTKDITEAGVYTGVPARKIK